MSDEAKKQQMEDTYAGARRRFPEVNEISAAELMAKLQAGEDLVLVDVREEAEQAVSMIPGAITRQQFEADLATHAGKTIVPYCTIGGRSGMYTQQLQSQGITALNFKGSILAWTHAGGELESTDGPTTKVHTYSKKFDLAAEGYETVW